MGDRGRREAVLQLQHREDLGAGGGGKERSNYSQTQRCGWRKGGRVGTG